MPRDLNRGKVDWADDVSERGGRPVPRPCFALKGAYLMSVIFLTSF